MNRRNLTALVLALLIPTFSAFANEDVLKNVRQYKTLAAADAYLMAQTKAGNVQDFMVRSNDRGQVEAAIRLPGSDTFYFVMVTK